MERKAGGAYQSLDGAIGQDGGDFEGGALGPGGGGFGADIGLESQAVALEPCGGEALLALEAGRQGFMAEASWPVGHGAVAGGGEHPCGCHCSWQSPHSVSDLHLGALFQEKANSDTSESTSKTKKP
jgi:hypothetical protein